MIDFHQVKNLESINYWDHRSHIKKDTILKERSRVSLDFTKKTLLFRQLISILFSCLITNHNESKFMKLVGVSSSVLWWKNKMTGLQNTANTLHSK